MRADLKRREPRCRICREEVVRVVVNELLDWRGVPITLGRDKGDRITYDSLWIHAKRHHDPAGIAAYWSTRIYKELRKALGG